MRISRHARMTRTAISPRFAMSTFTPLIVVVSWGAPGSRGSRGSPGSGSWVPVRVRGFRFGFVGSDSGSGVRFGFVGSDSGSGVRLGFRGSGSGSGVQPRGDVPVELLDIRYC